MLNNRILIDTSAYSFSKKGHSEIIKILQEVDKIYFNPIVLGELIGGYRYAHQKKQEEELKEFLCESRVEIITIDEATTERYAVIASALRVAGTPLPTNDVWIAASAMQHSLTVLTTDKHFQKIPQIVVLYHDP